MKLKIKLFLLAVIALISCFTAWLLQPGLSRRRERRQRYCLANELGLEFREGVETLVIDPNATVPVVSITSGASAKNLGYMRGTTGAAYAMLWSGLATAASMPLGLSPDSPYQAGDFFAVRRLGAVPGTMIGQSAGAITIDHLVYAAANGQIGDLQGATAGGGGGTTYWCIGRATKTITAAGQDISFVPFDPYLLTTTNGVITNPANPL